MLCTTDKIELNYLHDLPATAICEQSLFNARAFACPS